MTSDYSLNENLESMATSSVKLSENNENLVKNISPFVSKDLVAAAGFNVETPIVNAIIGNLTGTLPLKKTETEMIKCEICDCELSSNIVLTFHINGSRHKKRLKALEIIKQLKIAKDKGVQLGDSNYPNTFKCEICSLTVNSAQQLEIHLSGAKHKKNAARIGNGEYALTDSSKCFGSVENSDDSGSPPAKKRKREEQKILCCKICNIFMNSRTQYDQHLLSRKHLNKVNIMNRSDQKL